MKTGPLFTKIRDCKKKIIVCQGGGDAAKTITILQHFAIDSIETPDILTTVIGQDIPNLKAGALRSFQRYVLPDISNYISDYNKTDRVYTFKNRSVIEFKSFEDEQDARGSERDNLFVNEANSITYQLFWQLQRKTRRKIILDYNPSNVFWVHDKLLSGKESQFKDRVQLYITDHRHNPFLTQEEHDAYENIGDPDLFRVYSRGLTGKIKGLIFGHFKKIDLMPEQYERVVYGIDYGYTNDPSAIVRVVVAGRKRYIQELAYKPGISAEDINNLILKSGFKQSDTIYSEADPNMVNQLRKLGLPVNPAIKGPGSIMAGISKVKEFECYYTSESLNFEKEILNYKWIVAQDMLTGKEVMTNEPIDAWNHLCDAVRYAIFTDSFRHR